MSGDVLTQPQVIEDTQQDHCFEDLPEDTAIERMQVVSMGKDNQKPHLLVSYLVCLDLTSLVDTTSSSSWKTVP